MCFYLVFKTHSCNFVEIVSKSEKTVCGNEYHQRSGVALHKYSFD